MAAPLLGEVHFKSLIENIPEVIVIYDKSLRIIHINEATRQITNRPTSDFIGKTEEQIWPPEIYQHYLPQLKRVRKNKESEVVEAEITFPSGEKRFLQITIQPILDSQGKLLQIMGITRDLTTEVTREQELRLHLERMSNAEKSASMGSWEFDVLEGQGWWSEGMYKLFGINPPIDLSSVEEYLTLIHPDDQALLRKTFSEIGQGVKPQKRLFRRHPDLGELRWFSPSYEVVHDKGGRIVRFYGTLRDVTKEFLSQFRLDMFVKTIEKSTYGIILTDPVGKITFANKGMETISGYSRAELIGQTPRIFKSGRQGRAVYQELWKTILSGREWNGRLINKRKDGSTYIEDINITPYSDEFGNLLHFLAIKRNISQQDTREKLLGALNAIALDLHPTNDLGEIFRLVSKELKPLGYSSLLFPYDEEKNLLTTRYFSFSRKKVQQVEKILKGKLSELELDVGAEPLLSAIIQQQKTVLIENNELYLERLTPKRLKSSILKIAELLQLRESIATPIRANGKVIALFSLMSDELVEEHTHLVIAMADLITGAVEQGRLIARLEESFAEVQKARAEIEQRLSEISEVLNGTVISLASFAEKRDPYTSGHQEKVARISVAIARRLGQDENFVEGLRVASLLHDIGKVYVPAEILNKPGKLSAIEFDLIKTHSEVGADILKSINFPWPVTKAILQHHERLDGSGYPGGLKAKKIILEARIMGVADVIDAVSSHRPYRPALGLDKAIEEIKKGSGKIYDAEVVGAALEVIGKLDLGYQKADRRWELGNATR